MGNCFVSIVVWTMLNLTWLKRKVTFCFHNWWLPIRKLPLLPILFERLCIRNNLVELGVLLKIHLVFWKKVFGELILKSHLNILFLLDVVVCCCILYNMILDGKDQDIEILMTPLDLENDVNNMILCHRKEANA
jgi:hypothetical protein